MSGVILALVEHPESARQTLGAAGNLAALMGTARINVLAIRVPPETTIMPSEEVLTRSQETDIRAREEARIRALHEAFDTWVAGARSPQVTVEWVDVEGLAEALVAEWGRRSDYIVLARPLAHDRPAAMLELQSALFNSDRPVLVVPPGPLVEFGRHVAIAWREEKRTERAVLSALKLLPSAEGVYAIAGVSAGAMPPALPAMLAEHGIDADLHVLPIGSGPLGEALLHTTHEIGADLLVMGAYTHSPWREMMLGGVTKYMLAHADLPVLMRH